MSRNIKRRTSMKMKSILKKLVVEKLDEYEDIETMGIAKIIRKIHQLMNNYTITVKVSMEIIFCFLISGISVEISRIH